MPSDFDLFSYYYFYFADGIDFEWILRGRENSN